MPDILLMPALVSDKKGYAAKSVDETDKVWPEDLSYAAFKAHMQLPKNWIYKTLYELNCDQIQVKNQRIALEKLKKIIETAFSISAKQGYHSMNLRQLCDKAGISMGGLYAYISSKDELANLIETGLNLLIYDLIEQATSQITDTKHRLRAIICCHLYLSEQYHNWFYFVYMEARTMAKAQRMTARKTETEFEDKLTKLLNEAIAEGVLYTNDVYMTSTTLTALLQNWHLKREKYHSKQITVDHYARALVGALNQLKR